MTLCLRTSRFALIVSGVLLVLVAVPLMLTWRAWRQEMLDQDLIVAIKANDTKAVIADLRAGADPNARETVLPDASFWQDFWNRLRRKQTLGLEGQSALILGVSPTNIEDVSRNFDWLPKDAPLIQTLLDAGANPNLANANGQTPFMRAARFYRVEAMQMLLHYGSGINGKDNEGHTALWEVAANRRTETAEFLLKHHADPNAQDKEGVTPLMAVAEYADEHQETAVRMARLLLRYNADVNRRDAKGKTAVERVVNPDLAAPFLCLLKAAGAKE